MKLEVPFYKQQQKNDCAPTALKMVLDYLGEKQPKEKLIELVDSDASGATWTIALANTAAKLGLKSEFYTISLGFNSENYNLEFYKIKADSQDKTKIKLEKLKREAAQFKVNLQEKKLSLQEIKDKINEDCLAIVLLDWSIIRKIDSGFIGHTVPIVGYDSENIYVHNQGNLNPTEFLKIPNELFEQARKSPGTDEDIVFIYRNN